MDKDSTTLPMGESGHGTYKSYIIGFTLSIIFTLLAYYLVSEKILSGMTLVSTIVSLGVVQAFVQLIFFLHLGDEPKPYWNILVFLFMVLVVVIIVAGSLWIMHNLDQRLMIMEHPSNGF